MSRPVHLAIGQVTPRKGEYRHNLDRLGAMFARAADESPAPQLLHLPETALTGYFLEGGVREHAMTAGTLARDLAELHRRHARGRAFDVAIGFYELWEHKLYNSAMYLSLGEGEPVIRHIHRKVFLPTYGLFDEERFVERGQSVRAFDTPVGRVAMLVCEDAWHSLSGTLAALDGAEIVLVHAAAPARGAYRVDGVPGPASLARWERLVRELADEHGVFVSLAHLAGSEGGKLFAGGSALVGPKGDVRLRAPLWGEALATATIDLADLTRARADLPLIADLQTMMPHLVVNLGHVMARERAALSYEGAVSAPSEAPTRGAPPKHNDRSATPAAHNRAISPDIDPTRAGAPIPVVHACDAGGPPPLEIDPGLATEWLLHFIRQETAARHFRKAIVGVSGGVDSAVTAFLAARALGPENVIGVRMPYRTSSRESLEHGQLVIDALGIEGRTVDISPAVDGYLTTTPDSDATRRGNVMARIRMITIFDLSARDAAIPLGTGNKTERLFGYFTWHADDSPPVNPLGDLFKTQVWTLARHLGVPAPIVDKAPSADLVAGQTDEGDFGISYEKADRILNHLLSGYTPAEIVARGFPAAEVEIVRKRVDGTHWKRKLPTVAMLSHSAIGESYLRPVDY
ncbi:MAG: NAD+ synthase [Gemmatimonadaceae bacterium]|nr:NAD+ synthase [Gemmatimonadaceae bacterium]NUQ91797.1 NAD+ synthase [Gemmatimonadaceae bacterium]NUR18507.1 NAD+ synthase [Gemmatimonadaceae bacterium]NUS99053.1 NAD+ synthase [Gemmatimonadaceae bacterium]